MALIIREITVSSTESFWTFETDKAAHRHITSYTEGMQDWGEALHPTLARPSTCLPQDTASTGLSEIVCEDLRGLHQTQIYESSDPTVINQKWER